MSTPHPDRSKRQRTEPSADDGVQRVLEFTNPTEKGVELREMEQLVATSGQDGDIPLLTPSDLLRDNVGYAVATI